MRLKENECKLKKKEKLFRYNQLINDREYEKIEIIDNIKLRLRLVIENDNERNCLINIVDI